VAAIARREALRRAALRLEAPLEEGRAGEDAAAAGAFEALARRLDVQAALGALEPEERRLLDLRYGSDMTQRAIAEELGVPEGTVKVRLHRLRVRLKDELR